MGASLAWGLACGAPQALAEPDFTLDLTAYSPRRALALADLEALQKAADALSAAQTPDALGAALVDADGLVGRARRLSAYFNLLAARDLDDLAARSARDKADAVHDQVLERMRNLVRAVPATAFADQARRDPRLARFAYLETQAGERAAHDLPPDQARVLDAMEAPALDGYWSAYQKTSQLRVEGQESAAAPADNSPDRLAREAAWREKWRVAGVKADANATLLLAIVQLEAAAAHLRRYPDAPAAGYAGRGLDPAQVKRTLQTVRAALPLYRDYLRVRAERLAAAGIATPEPWDAPLLRGHPDRKFGFDEVRRLAPEVLAPLGPDYVQRFTAMLDPAAGRLDLASDLGRRESGGFSVKAPGVPAGLYVARFGGALNDVRVVFHEGGHAIAAQFDDEGGGAQAFTLGPNWLMEGYAIFNEMLLYDHLARTAPTPAEREAFAAALVDDMMFQVFGSAEEATLEQAIYDGAAAGKIQSAADLNAVAFAVEREFEPWSDGALRTSSPVWSTKQLLYQDPFYLVNYLYAGLVAIDLYAEAKTHPDTFPARYGALLRRGYDAPPADLLAPMFGSSASTDALAARAFPVMRAALADLAVAQAEAVKAKR